MVPCGSGKDSQLTTPGVERTVHNLREWLQCKQKDGSSCLRSKLCTGAAPCLGHIPSVFYVRKHRGLKTGSNDKRKHIYCNCSFVVSRIYVVLAVLNTLSHRTTLLLIVWIWIHISEEAVVEELVHHDSDNVGETQDNNPVFDNPSGNNARFFYLNCDTVV
jgi:hypothetical protein